MLEQSLRDHRKAAKMSQKDLATKLFVSAQAISKWECGDATPNPEALRKMAEIYGITVDELIGNNPPRATTKKEAPLTIDQGNQIIQKALAGTGLLDADGQLTPRGEEIISDFIRRNAELLKQIVEDGK